MLSPTYEELQAENARLVEREQDLLRQASDREQMWYDLEAQLAAAREETQEYAERVGRWRAAGEERDSDEMPSEEACNEYDAAEIALIELALTPPNGESALKRAAKLEDDLGDLRDWLDCFYPKELADYDLHLAAALAETAVATSPHVHNWGDVVDGKDSGYCWGCGQTKPAAARVVRGESWT